MNKVGSGNDQSAAEWLEEIAEAVGDEWSERFVIDAAPHLLAMLCDAKAELEQAKRELDRYPTYTTMGDETAFEGWDAIETKWRKGDYK